MMKKKLLILQGSLMQYRVPTWNILGEKYDLTLGYYEHGLPSSEGCNFQIVRFDYRRVGSFDIVRGVRKYANQFDVVCILPDPHIISFAILPFIPHKYKLLTWSIGFRCSYSHPYKTSRKHTFIDDIYYKRVFNSVDANIFYMKSALEFWGNDSIELKKIFIAPNTTGVEPLRINAILKKNFLFVGTLYKGKGLETLIDSFNTAIHVTHSDAKLMIIGKGEMHDYIVKYIEDRNLVDRVILTGAIYKESILANYFAESLLCISPNQGGLTCPKSMGYGVPFVCRKDAITGGEIYHMTNGVNGIMYEKDSDLTDVLIDAIKNPKKYIEMGEKAKSYYDNNATPSHMAKGAIDAIEYSLGNE